MVTIRVPAAQPIESRTNSFSQDSYTANGYFSKRNGITEFVKRPGLVPFTNNPLLSRSNGQGLFNTSIGLFGIAGNELFLINTSGGGSASSSLGTLFPYGGYPQMSSAQTDGSPFGSVTQTVTFSTAGFINWTVPATVTSIVVTAIGAGGGGSGYIGANYPNGAGGGGSGGYVVQTVSVTGGDTVGVTVGSGGAGGALNTAGSLGGTTTVTHSATTVTAGGGAGGSGNIGGGGGYPGGTAGQTQGAGGSSYYTTLFGVTTSGGGSFVGPATAGTYGGGGGGGGIFFANYPAGSAGGNGYVSITYTIPGGTACYAMFNDYSGIAYYNNASGGTFGHVSFGFTMDPLCYGIVYIDGYTVVCTVSGRVYNATNYGDPTTWAAGDWISAVQQGDSAVAIAQQLNYVVVFGNTYTTFLYDATNPTNSPFSINSSAGFPVGCAAATSVVEIPESIIWIGQSSTKGRSVYMLEGTTPIVVSNTYIDQYLDGDSLTTVYAWAMTFSGHLFYVLSLVSSNITLVYDVTMNVWYRWTSWNFVQEQYFSPAFGASGPDNYWYMDVNGNVGYLSESAYQDGDASIYLRCITNLLDFGTSNRKNFSRFEIISDTPKVNSLGAQISHTGNDYQSWSTPRTVNLARVSSRKNLYQLGKNRRRAFQFLYIDPQPLRIDSFELDIDIPFQNGNKIIRQPRE